MPATPSFYSRVFTLAVAAVLGLCAAADFQAVRAAHDLGCISCVSAVSGQSSLAAPPQGQIDCRRRADGARAHRHSLALERAVGRVRVANIRVAQATAKIRHRDGYQVVLGSAAISLDRAHQYLAAGARRYIRGAGAILAGVRNARGNAARRELGRLVFPGGARLAAGFRDHAVSACSSFCAMATS